MLQKSVCSFGSQVVSAFWLSVFLKSTITFTLYRGPTNEVGIWRGSAVNDAIHLDPHQPIPQCLQPR